MALRWCDGFRVFISLVFNIYYEYVVNLDLYYVHDKLTDIHNDEVKESLMCINNDNNNLCYTENITKLPAFSKLFGF